MAKKWRNMLVHRPPLMKAVLVRWIAIPDSPWVEKWDFDYRAPHLNYQTLLAKMEWRPLRT